MKDWYKGFPGVFPWGGAIAFGRQRFFEAGEIRLAILSLLGEGPKHGYQLMKEMRERSNGCCAPVDSTSTVLVDERLSLIQPLPEYGLSPNTGSGGARESYRPF